MGLKTQYPHTLVSLIKVPVPLHGQATCGLKDGHDRVIIPGTFQTPLRGLLRNKLRSVVGYLPWTNRCPQLTT